ANGFGFPFPSHPPNASAPISHSLAFIGTTPANAGSTLAARPCPADSRNPNRNTTSGFLTLSPPNAPRKHKPGNKLNRPPHETRGAVAVSRSDPRPTSFFHP